MKKQTIYSYLQRSLVKVLTKSINSNRYKSSLAKPLNRYSASITSYAKIRPVRKFKKLGSMVFLLAKHKYSKTLNFFRRVDTKKSLMFTCQFSLISFIRPKLTILLSRPYGETLLNLTLHRKLKLVKLNQGLNNNKLLFLPLLHGTYFYSKAHISQFLILQAKLCTNLLVNVFFVRLSVFHFNDFYKIKTLVAGSWNHVTDNFGQPKKDSNAFCFALLCLARERSFFVNGNYSSSQLFSYSKKKWYLFEKKKEKEKNTNFYFYSKKLKPYSSLWPTSFGSHKSYPFHQSFYKRLKTSINYMKTFQKLSDFFSLFSISRNNKISIFHYAGLVRQALQAQEVLYLRKIDNFPCSFHLFYLFNTNIDHIIPLCSLRNRTSKSKKENQNSFFKVLFFLTLIFYLAIKYIKEKKEKELYKQSTLKVSMFQFNEVIENNFLSFRPFYGKVVGIRKAPNSPDFFLMRPLFSLTRLDTFSICESLKLPIYPDKSNLRVDFLRNRVRKQILPAIRILLNPQFDTILCKFNESDG